jgi:3-deoxy-D-manno-octulosonate 8-phosphate phosphatase (KDO 8-P phosphatase)
MPLESDAKLLERLRAVELLVLDVDGVLTEGSIVYDESGNEWKHFHVRDGSGLKIWNHVGKKAAIITGRTSRLVDRRAAELGISPVIQGAQEKVPALRDLVRVTGVSAERMCAIGDDVPDLGMMANCGLAVAVADACPEVRQAAHFVTRAVGGRGAVREAIELILHAQGRWSPIVERFLNERL